MIYTVTLNPSLDVMVALSDLQLGQVNRMLDEQFFVGGKGINVSRILQRLNYDNVATGFIGGFTGDFIQRNLLDEGLICQFVSVSGDSRINIKLSAGLESELNAPGPVISMGETNELYQILSQVTKQDMVVFSGSQPKGLTSDFYHQLLTLVTELGAEVVCDFEGDALLEALPFKPLVIKPNHDELAQLFGIELTNKDKDQLVFWGRQLLDKGAKQVIVSMAEEGAMLLTPEKTYVASPIKGQVKNSVGAGDSLLAGFVGCYQETKNLLSAFQLGIACGTATAFSEDLANLDLIQKLYKQVKIVEYTPSFDDVK